MVILGSIALGMVLQTQLPEKFHLWLKEEVETFVTWIKSLV